MSERATHPESHGHWDCWQISNLLYQRDALAEALRRYRKEVPLGHQPHMLAHEVDALLAELEKEKKRL